ncbi:hypothetical protein BC628DRAFT_1357770 [Trametes gibbosa]|nr:hypothetical protein BC628DRAFT_1357770 [Trametes gibbosa]
MPTARPQFQPHLHLPAKLRECCLLTMAVAASVSFNPMLIRITRAVCCEPNKKGQHSPAVTSGSLPAQCDINSTVCVPPLAYIPQPP